MQFYTDTSMGIAMFPPEDGEERAWLEVGGIMMRCIEDPAALDPRLGPLLDQAEKVNLEELDLLEL